MKFTATRYIAENCLKEWDRRGVMIRVCLDRSTNKDIWEVYRFSNGHACGGGGDYSSLSKAKKAAEKYLLGEE